MINDEDKNKQIEDFKKLLDENIIKPPVAGDTVEGTVLSASKSEVRLDIDGIQTGIVRGRELYQEADEYSKLKPGDTVEATVIEEENENGEIELSFRFAGQEKAWAGLKESFEKKKILKVKIVEANKGGLIAHFCQIFGFLPVSQLAPENYPRVNGGDKTKILDKLKSFMGKELEVKVITMDEKEDKIIFSEKEAWNELQKDIISQYGVGKGVDGVITAVTDFGVFVSFGENLEGLIHISELAWQRIDDPSDLYKVGDAIKAEIISVEGSKIFLSAKKLLRDPWENVNEKYKIGSLVKGTILKVNPFGLFVKLDDEIHGLAHVSQLNLAPGQKINELFKVGNNVEFEIVSIEPKEHRLGLAMPSDKKSKAPKEAKKEKKDEDESDNSDKTDEKTDDKEVKKKEKSKGKKSESKEDKKKETSEADKKKKKSE